MRVETAPGGVYPDEKSRKSKGMKMQAAIAPIRVSGSSTEALAGLFQAFWGNYGAFKAGKMSMDAEENYRIFGVPGPSQYQAFFRFFQFFKDREEMVQKQDYIYMYDLLEMEQSSEPAMLEFLKNIDSPVFDVRGKDVILAFGSFWGQHHPTRARIISLLANLHSKGADVRIYTQAAEDEKHIADIIAPVKQKSRFGLKKRIPIHFIRVGGEYVFFEFPHTETTAVRLNMLLDINAHELAPGQTKEGLLNFFDGLIQGALEG